MRETNNIGSWKRGVINDAALDRKLLLVEIIEEEYNQDGESNDEFIAEEIHWFSMIELKIFRLKRG